MQLLRGSQYLTHSNSSRVVTIGKFDGVHLGHQDILSRVIESAKEHNAKSTVIVFEPDPIEYFSPDKAPARITSWREKWQLLEDAGIDALVCLRFSDYLSTMSPERFINDILIDRLQVKHLIVGDDFRFGHNRAGHFDTLKEYGKNHFSVENTASIKQSDDRISSTLIRTRLKEGRLNQVKRLLGRDFSMSGRVIHGDKIGRTIDFPTINIAHKRKKLPLSGVYLVRVEGVDGAKYGVANVGRRPTVNGVEERFEIHLMNYNKDCYGAKVTADFLHKIRDEQRFTSLDQLKLAIQNDVNQAKALINKFNNISG